MAALSSNLLLVAFFLYLAATILFAVSLPGKNFRNKQGEIKNNKWGTYGFVASIIASLFSLGYFVTRWIAAGHAPVSNMFEYMTFLGIAIGIAFVILYMIYRTNVLGLFTMPVVMLMIAYASVFPREIAPLIPALQSNWLKIHVITVALGQGILAIGFAAGLIYLIRTIDFTKRNKKTVSLELIMYGLISTIGFILITNVFNMIGYEAEFSYINENGVEASIVYELPAIIGPNEGTLLTNDRLEPIINAPAIIRSDDLNTVLWSFFAGAILYVLIRSIARKRVAAIFQPLVKSISPQTIDEVSYRAIAIGFPVFALGGLIFAMIWAQIAWSRFWGWDPKEVWALITFLFYAAYLHLRLSKGWHGERSAWLGVIGFAIIMFNLVFVNLVIAGLHSYAG
ncbi:cytochrome C biogenesis protein [Alkalihalobacillus alcalophilus ATCC 27647 = CGMCC 1.3604]|uniref:Cytochrome C biogenesis protein n=1 Tax=Alkalihalobacillus alcalophilus ATCC 27647 = CGMCC 1.3604 TaxID=1218173 RepID=J8TF05_ALKAL|nr:c-type cytochrome biogenesis protein CcsB [Alkalihalobacillus alcalophilus]AFV25983.1 heme export transporter [Alkalihalobacillus alcalophilus ATCC 27647 = CGMCC 1.3604]KGA98551.1 cytochrome C biogenesis protein [Alkalihalobacillus alcalophilus ATCC 27647 = CGMCC 1.3604]MED1560392.1 c-type cytochrome biogenesis protein CcsB [Alkalihalobacillus alcalophilus]THG89186.1 cytochrome C biogenesis protein [Alkalihalobacillus alcalophilus ATCC 27647 = CGMCC 1.3604]